MRETGKAALRPTLLPNQFKRKQQSKKPIHSESSNFLPDELPLKPSFPFPLPTQQKSMPEQIKKCNNTIVLPSEDRRIIKTSNKSLQMIQYEKIDTTLNDSQEMKKQIEKYLFDRFLHWVQHLTEGQIREVYDEIVRERRFLQAKEMKYEWMQRQRKIKEQQQNLTKKQEFKQRCEREQRQRISNKCRQILSCQSPAQARKSLAPIQQKQALKIKLPTQAISIQQSLSEVEQQSHKILDFQISIPSYVDEDENKNPSLLQNTNNCRQENQQYSPIQSLISTVDAIREIGGKKYNGNQECRKYLRVSRTMEQLREMEEIKEIEEMGMPSKRLRREGNEEAKVVESQRKLKDKEGLKQGNGAVARKNLLKESGKGKSQQKFVATEKYQIRNFVVLVQKFEIGSLAHPHDAVQF